MTDKRPFYVMEEDGVTFSLLATFSECREKAKLYLDGWSSKRSGLAIVFGSIMHWLLQHIYDDIRIGKLRHVPAPKSKYLTALLDEVEALWKVEHPIPDADSLEHFELTMLLVEAVIPLYCHHWHGDDFSKIQWQGTETVFGIPITVKDKAGRSHATVLRGKRDADFKYAGKKSIRLFETKTKSRISEDVLSDVLHYERQTAIYLSALRRETKTDPGGVLLNIIRRPALRQKVKETLPAFAARIVEDIQARAEWYFLRLEMRVDRTDLDRNDDEIEQLIADFILWHIGEAGHYKNSGACENKYGTCQYLGACARNDFGGLFKRDVVFRELEDA